jgi:hypothetical protein
LSYNNLSKISHRMSGFASLATFALFYLAVALDSPALGVLATETFQHNDSLSLPDEQQFL